MTAKSKKAASRGIEFLPSVDIGLIHANQHNPNKMNDREFKAVQESIESFGFIDPVTVRPHPTITGEYEVVDGEHRWRAATEMGLKEIPVIVGELSETDAKRLTIILNETRGMADRVDLGVLLSQLNDEIGFDELQLGLPFTSDAMQSLIELGEVDLPEYQTAEQVGPGSGGDAPESDPGAWVSVTFRIPSEVNALLEEAKERFRENPDLSLHNHEHIANGQVLEAALAELFASS